MGFPDTFILDRGSRRDRIRMIGNAVCPPVMKEVIEALLDTAGARQMVSRRSIQLVA
jgi:DNA (cytosine-5)-methyltransferase 1